MFVDVLFLAFTFVIGFLKDFPPKHSVERRCTPGMRGSERKLLLMVQIRANGSKHCKTDAVA